MLLRSNPRRIALAIGLLVALLGGAAGAADTTAGSKNFNVPAMVPNYFSNEAGPLQGPASETRRGTLYSSGATAEVPQPTARTVAVVVPRSRQHIAMAEPRGRAIRGRVTYERRGRAVAARRIVTRDRPIYHAVAHARSRVERVAVRAHPVAHHPTRVSSAHRRGRG